MDIEHVRNPASHRPMPVLASGAPGWVQDVTPSTTHRQEIARARRRAGGRRDLISMLRWMGFMLLLSPAVTAIGQAAPEVAGEANALAPLVGFVGSNLTIGYGLRAAWRFR